MEILNRRLREELNLRKEEGRFRKLSEDRIGIDIYSNDYLGFSRNKELGNRLKTLLEQYPDSVLGATGSRLISGNSNLVMEIEAFIARNHQFESALLFPSGYVANQSLFSVVPKKTDTIIVDEKVHRSVYDGCRLSMANRWKFRHNDLDHLEELIKRSSGHVWVGVESLYSMDGDFAPLAEIAALCDSYSAALIVDEAHAIGTFGLGLVSKYRLQDKVFASIVTYGKAMGQSGAAVLGSSTLIDYLINYSPAFIYSTGLPDFNALAIKESYEFLDSNVLVINNLNNNIKRFYTFIDENKKEELSPIIPIRFSDQKELGLALEKLTENGFLSYAIKSPTVAIGEEMIRICIHSFNSNSEIDLLSNIIREIKYG